MHVKRKATIIYIIHIVFKFLLPADGIASVDLCPTCDAGAYFVATGLLFTIEWEVFHKQGPWPDKAHIAFDDIDELWYFVQACFADEFTYGCESLRIGQEIAGFVALVVHGFELDDLKESGIFSWPGLGKEGLAGVGKPQQDGDD